LEAAGVSVRFGGVQALSDVGLQVRPGRITGLIGPNGAGKTTLFNVICGLQKPTEGRVLLGGRDVGRLGPHRRARLGLSRTFQRLEVFGSLSVRDNILAGAEFHRSWSRTAGDPRAKADRLVARIGLEAVAAARVDTLPTGLARLVELGRALATEPRVLLLDEPASGLDSSETEALDRLLVELARAGLAVLLVEHDIELVMRICTELNVLDFGRVIASGPPEVVREQPDVQAAYLGELSV
jgi:branched-chain amino acid transport system ATP-binding protein